MGVAHWSAHAAHYLVNRIANWVGVQVGAYVSAIMLQVALDNLAPQASHKPCKSTRVSGLAVLHMLPYVGHLVAATEAQHKGARAWFPGGFWLFSER